MNSYSDLVERARIFRIEGLISTAKELNLKDYMSSRGEVSSHEFACDFQFNEDASERFLNVLVYTNVLAKTDFNRYCFSGYPSIDLSESNRLLSLAEDLDSGRPA